MCDTVEHEMPGLAQDMPRMYMHARGEMMIGSFCFFFKFFFFLKMILKKRSRGRKLEKKSIGRSRRTDSNSVDSMCVWRLSKTREGGCLAFR